MTRREEHRANTRAEMLAAALGLFRAQGYEATNVEDIAARAGVSARTFYRYFVSKDGILAEYGLLVTSAVAERATPDARVPELVRLYADVLDESMRDEDFTSFLRLLRENPSLRDRAYVWRQRWAEHLAGALTARADDGHGRLHRRVRTTLAVQLVNLALDEWLREGGIGSVGPYADRVAAAADEEVGAVEAGARGRRGGNCHI